MRQGACEFKIIMNEAEVGHSDMNVKVTGEFFICFEVNFVGNFL